MRPPQDARRIWPEGWKPDPHDARAGYRGGRWVVRLRKHGSRAGVEQTQPFNFRPIPQFDGALPIRPPQRILRWELDLFRRAADWRSVAFRPRSGTGASSPMPVVPVIPLSLPLASSAGPLASSAGPLDLRIIAPLVCGLVGGALLIWRRPVLRGTTLVAPWTWAMIAVAAVAGAELLIVMVARAAGPSWAPHLRYIAAVTTFGPLVALLGAKRPQDRAWQAIVASLVLILMAPACWAALYRPGSPFELDAAWRWFLLILVAVGALNGLPTRNAMASVLFAAAQATLMASHLPLVSRWLSDVQPLWGLALGTAAIAAWAWRFPPRRSESAEPLDRLWLDFRDWFAALWALRMAERFNRSAAMYGWPVRLSWFGVEPVDGTSESMPQGTIPEATQKAMMTNLRMLLRRFVSEEWIAERTDKGMEA